MKKGLIAIICILIVNRLIAQIIESHDINLHNNSAKKNSAIFIRPFEIYENVKNKIYGISFEAETAFTSIISLKTIQNYYYGNTIFYEGVFIGPQVNLFENALEGFNIGIYPGAIFDIGEKMYHVQPKIIGELAINLILANNLGIGFYLSNDFLNLNSYSLGIKIGVIFENDKYKVY